MKESTIRSAIMDPLSITAATVGLAAQVLRVAVGVKNIVEELQDAPAFACDIAHDITIVHASLREVELALARNPQAIERYSLDDVFDESVRSCRATLLSIKDEFAALFERADWKARFAVWWNSDSIRRLLENLNTKKGSLMLLVQTMNLRSVDEMRELLQRNQATLDLAHMGLVGMMPSYPPVGTRGVDFAASEIASDDGLLGDRESFLSDSRFAFDEVCIASKAYRKTVVDTLRGNRLARPKARDVLPQVLEKHDQETENQSEISVETNVPSPAPATVPADVHEEVCSRLREMQARNQQLEEEVLALQEQLHQVTQTSDQKATQDASRRPLAETRINQPQGVFPPEPSPHIASTDEPKLSSGESRMRTPWTPKVTRWSPVTDADKYDLNRLGAAHAVLRSRDQRPPGPRPMKSRQKENLLNDEPRGRSSERAHYPVKPRASNKLIEPAEVGEETMPSTIHRWPVLTALDATEFQNSETHPPCTDAPISGIEPIENRATSSTQKEPEPRRSRRAYPESTNRDLRPGRDGIKAKGEGIRRTQGRIADPKLLETVEDAIRRLILPELNALEREKRRAAAGDSLKTQARGSPGQS